MNLHDVRSRELANLANLVSDYFEGDQDRVALWLGTANPMLGGISPTELVCMGRYQVVLDYVLEAQADNAAAEHMT